MHQVAPEVTCFQCGDVYSSSHLTAFVASPEHRTFYQLDQNITLTDLARRGENPSEPELATQFRNRNTERKPFCVLCAGKGLKNGEFWPIEPA